MQRDKELMMATIRRVTVMLEDDSYDWGEEEARDLDSAVGKVVTEAIHSVK